MELVKAKLKAKSQGKPTKKRDQKKKDKGGSKNYAVKEEDDGSDEPTPQASQSQFHQKSKAFGHAAGQG